MKRKLLDSGSTVVAVVTLGLFVGALFIKGLTHDLFLEAGVFLVSIKLILLAHRNSLVMDRMEAKLDSLTQALARQERARAETPEQQTAPRAS